MNLNALGEQTIFMDCGILQADGDTRIACITAAYLVLKAAQAVWLEEGILLDPILLVSSIGWVCPVLKP